MRLALVVVGAIIALALLHYVGSGPWLFFALGLFVSLSVWRLFVASGRRNRS